MASVAKLPRPTEMAHRLLSERIQEGDTVVDATVGNGHDTLFLANCVGENGHVIGFDLQAGAIEKTRKRTGNRPNITLHQAGHETLDDFIAEPIAAITFNLGYLPGGDKNLITDKESTLTALKKSVAFLEPGGLLTVVAYIGHEGGPEEGEAVSDWASSLDQDNFSVARYEFQNQRNSPPFLLAIEKRM
ncbi:MAG: methyltransferase domain-containing protein [Verrucomicrobiales bacterium]|nr:methyltransferase domain-containing protein [Verrucomicrobiales bacterium]